MCTYTQIHMHRTWKIIGVYQDCQFPGSHIYRKAISNLCNIKELANYDKNEKWLAYKKNEGTICNKKCIHAILVAITGNAMKRDHRGAHMRTANSTRLKWKRSRSGSNCLLSASRSLIFLSLPEMTEGPYRSLAE